MTEPLVSVLLPYRDAASTLEEALDGVLSQRGVEVEVLLVDDGSQDRGPAVARSLAARHAAITLLATGGEGLVAALRLGSLHARGPFLARMDADDVCLDDRFALQVDALRARPALAAIGSRVDSFPAEATGEGMRRYVAWQNALVEPVDHRREIFVESPLCHPSVTMRREAFDSVGGYRSVDGAEDYDLWLRLDEAGGELAKVPEVLHRWRCHPARLTPSSPHLSLDRLREQKAPFLARRLRELGRRLVVWGAGPTGKRTARALERHGLPATAFVDIDPRKIGRTARGASVVGADALSRNLHTVVVAVGVRGARDLVRADLDRRGFTEGADYLCAS